MSARETEQPEWEAKCGICGEMWPKNFLGGGACPDCRLVVAAGTQPESSSTEQAAFAAAHGSAPQGVAAPRVESGILGVGGVLPPVLDACCGPRFMWFNPKDSRAVFMDRRRETVKGEWGPGSKGRRDLQINPDVLADFTAMPFPSDSFDLVVLDPPHIRRLEMLGKVSATFGVLVPGWEEMLAAGFRECFRVLRPSGTLIFKWCEVEVPLDRVLALTPEKPLFGHRSGKKAATHWVAFLKDRL